MPRRHALQLSQTYTNDQSIFCAPHFCIAETYVSGFYLLRQPSPATNPLPVPTDDPLRAYPHTHTIHNTQTHKCNTHADGCAAGLTVTVNDLGFLSPFSEALNKPYGAVQRTDPALYATNVATFDLLYNRTSGQFKLLLASDATPLIDWTIVRSRTHIHTHTSTHTPTHTSTHSRPCVHILRLYL